MEERINVEIVGLRSVEVTKNTTLLEIAKNLNIVDIVCASVNNELCDLIVNVEKGLVYDKDSCV